MTKNRLSKIIVRSVFVLATFMIYLSCAPNSPEAITAVEKNQETPSLTVKELETFISDSGLVKYKVLTPLLLQFDSKAEPYTEFPKGVHLSSLNKDLKVNAEIKGNYAKYLKKKELWELKNNVEATNYQGNKINTECLFWDMTTHKIYSDDFIKITTDKQIITGVGFESNEDFSKYKILKINGIIELKE